ncbi:MAG: hypothetical protein ACD_2C00149G0001, partial [uncultured bacterium (gcode 4)]
MIIYEPHLGHLYDSVVRDNEIFNFFIQIFMYAKNKDLDINNNAFTLVELIVVIVILAILATIAFLSFSDYSSSARDSARLSDTANIRKWIELRQAI